ncbi:MAG: MoaD/ThiS family protein [Chloroflexi bacterium]|nr:MoaD/ThiS family protein [Chloroflexota bacterium]
MRITVKLYATLRRFKPDLPPGAGFSVDVPLDATVSQVVEQLGIPDGVALVPMVNNEVKGLDHVLAEGDTLSLFPPVAGG